MIDVISSSINNIAKIVDRVLQGNLYANTAAGLTSLLGGTHLGYISALMTRDNIVSWAVTISAVTGAIYGVYRVADLVYKGINKLINKKN